MTLDWVRLGQAILVQACQDAKRDDPIGAEAREWLICQPNRLRDTILEAATNLSQDDLNRLVEGYGGSASTG